MGSARPRARLAILLVGVGLVVSGCTAGPTPVAVSQPVSPSGASGATGGFDGSVVWEPRTRITLPAMSQEQKMEAREQFLANVWGESKSQWPDLGEPPQAEFVKFGDAAGGDQLLADCYTEAGYPAAVSPQGGVEFPGGVQASPQFAIVEYTCNARFTPDPLMLRDWNADQLGLLYDYRVEWLIPCLETFGLSPKAGPDRNTFINDFPMPDSEARSWWPEEATIGSANRDDILRACPPVPVEHFYGS